MSTVVTAPSDSVVVKQITSVVVTPVNGGTPVVTPQTGGGTVVVSRGGVGRAGPAGPAGGETLVVVGPTALSGHSIVAVSAAGLLIPADCTVAGMGGTVLGMLDSAYLPGASARVQTGYVIEHSGWNWAPGFLVVGEGGQPTQTLPVGAIFSQAIGKVLSPTSILVDLQPPIFLQ